VATATDIKPVNFKAFKTPIMRHQEANAYKNYVAYSVTEQALNSRVVHWYVEK
jgi:hypothetical protein